MARASSNVKTLLKSARPTITPEIFGRYFRLDKSSRLDTVPVDITGTFDSLPISVVAAKLLSGSLG